MKEIDEMVEKIIIRITVMIRDSIAKGHMVLSDMIDIQAEIRTLLQSVKHESRQQSETKIQGELNNIIKILYTSEKIQLTHSEVLRLANRLEAIEKLLQSHMPSVTREEIDGLFYRNKGIDGGNFMHPNDLIEWLKSKGIEVKEEK